MKNDYTYAVARIRVRETELLGRGDMDRLLAAKGPEEVLKFLAEKGWGKGSYPSDVEEMFSREREKIWELMDELLPDVSVLSVFKYQTDYHNLKAAIKLAYTHSGLPARRLFEEGGMIEPDVLLQCAKERDFSSLPAPMKEAAQNASHTLLHTGNGQLCDMILDRACLEAVYQAGKASGDPMLAQYGTVTTAAANIRIAVRCGRCKKSFEFILKGLASMEELDTGALAAAAQAGVDEVADYLETTEFSGAAKAVRTSDGALERWCSDLLISSIRPQKSNPFTPGPLAAYILAKENEIKYARMILSVKQNGLPEEILKERVGEIYG